MLVGFKVGHLLCSRCRQGFRAWVRLGVAGRQRPSRSGVLSGVAAGLQQGPLLMPCLQPQVWVSSSDLFQEAVVCFESPPQALVPPFTEPSCAVSGSAPMETDRVADVLSC